MSTIDECAQLLTVNALGLEALRAAVGPRVDEVAHLFRRRVLIPAGASRAEVRTRVENSRPILLARVNVLAQMLHALGIELAGWPRRYHAVGEEDYGEVVLFVQPHFAEEVEIVVAVHTERTE